MKRGTMWGRVAGAVGMRAGQRLGGPHRTAFGEGWRAALAIGALALGLAACNEPTRPAVPGGGRDWTLDEPYFAAHVDPIFVSRGCTKTAGCHGGQGAGMLLLSDGSNVHADFVTVRPHTRPEAPAASPLLLKPLAASAGGLVHGGGDIFADTLDTDYLTIYAWIAGAREPASVIAERAAR